MSHFRVRARKSDDLDGLYQLVRVSVPEFSAWLASRQVNYSRLDTAAWRSHCERAWEANIAYPMGMFDVVIGL